MLHFTPDRAALIVQALWNVALLQLQGLLASLAQVSLGDLHPALAQRQEPGLGADGLDVRAAQVVLGVDELLQVDVLRHGHLGGVDLEDFPLGLGVRVGQLDLAIDAPRTDQRGVERLDAVRRHDHLDVRLGVEPVQLVQQLQHGALDLLLSAARRVVPLRANGVDFVDEDDGRGVLLSDPEHLAHQLRPLAQVLLDQLRAHNTQERGRRLVRHRLGQQRFTRAGRPVQDDAFGRADPNVLVQLRVGQRELHRLLDLLDLLLQPSDVRVGLQGRAVHLHERHQGVRVVQQDAHHAVGLVVQQH
ncbi:uncharacterized protein BcabD6B2_23950 [Babesia caballi]|uniref:Uncharacterized protein n=1 Tax=Babesia caballi TaxID=5871 RepID=A0AAV4LT51_BABCB|nr:hypothetical protein BcabD6B2_23950 [Babesia caballi]